MDSIRELKGKHTLHEFGELIKLKTIEENKRKVISDSVWKKLSRSFNLPQNKVKKLWVLHLCPSIKFNGVKQNKYELQADLIKL